MGLGAMLANQTTAVLAAMVIYLGGTAAAVLVAEFAHQFYPHGWVLGTPVVAPAVASVVMTSATSLFDHAPPPWIGLAVLLSYALGFLTAGLALTLRRDLA